MAKPVIAFSEREQELIRQAADGVWHQHAYEVLQQVAAEQGVDIDTVTIPRTVVMTIALGTGRTEARLKRRQQRDGTVTDDLILRFRAADAKTLCDILKPAFPFQRYGTNGGSPIRGKMHA